MESVAVSAKLIRFGLFELDLRARELRKQGIRIRLQDQPLQILELLLQHPGELVTREELRNRIWPADTFVDFDKGLYSAMNRLRDALQDSPENPRFIETVPKRGYRFIAPVTDEGKALSKQPAVVEQEGHTGSGADVSRSWIRNRGMRTRVLLAMLLVLSTGWFLGSNWRVMRDWLFPRPPQRFHALAVLPLENLSGDSSQGIFADEMTEELITQLSKLPDTRVISRTTVMQYRGTSKRLPQIASELNVDAVVEGAVQRVGDRVRITAQLADAKNDHQLWAETYDRDMKDVLFLQTEVARDVAAQCEITLTPQQQQRLENAHAVQPESYEAYLMGRYYINKRTGDGMTKAAAYFRQAIAKDPRNALAYAGLADFYAFTSLIGGPEIASPISTMADAKNAAQRSEALDDSLAEAHASMANILHNYDWDFVGAEREFKRAIQLNPSYATAHHEYSHYLMQVGRTQESLNEATRARELDPLSPFINNGLARQYFLSRQYDKTIAQTQKALEIDPTYIPAMILLGMAYEQKSMFPEAIAQYENAHKLAAYAMNPAGDSRPTVILPVVTAMLGHALAVSGRANEANAKLQQLLTLSRSRYVAPSYIAVIYIGLGNKEQAFAWLEKGFQNRSEHLLYLKVEPMVDPLRGDPRLTSLLTRIGLPR